MAYVLVTTAEFSDDDMSASRRLLAGRLIPAAKALPGFQSGRWSRAGRKGVGTIVFDTEANANEGRATLEQNRPPGGPKITSTEVYEVMGEA